MLRISCFVLSFTELVIIGIFLADEGFGEEFLWWFAFFVFVSFPFLVIIYTYLNRDPELKKLQSKRRQLEEEEKIKQLEERLGK